MRYGTWLRRAGWLGVVGIAALTASSAWADDDKPAEDKSPPGKEETLTKEKIKEAAKGERAERPRTAKYWLEMQVVPVSQALAEQLDLKGEGVLVGHVRPEGPAGKGGIKDNDVLLAIGDKPIKDLTDVVTAINASEGKELSIKLMRAGKTMNVTATPVERVRRDPEFWPEGRPFGDVDVRDMEKAIRDKMKKAGVDLRMQLIQPGKVFPQGARLNIQMREFPDDLTVNIHKEGKKPADVEVKRGDKTWNVKEDALAQLPDDVREHVETYLGKNSHALMLRLAKPSMAPHPPGPPRADGPGADDEEHGRADRPPRGEGRGRRPPRPDGPEGDPGDHPPRPEGAERRPPGPPHAEGAPPNGPGERPGRPRGARGDSPGDGGPGRADRTDERLERRLEQMNRRMEEMHREFEGLRRSLRDRPRDRDEEEEEELELEFDNT